MLDPDLIPEDDLSASSQHPVGSNPGGTMFGAWNGSFRRSLALALILVELNTACMGWHTTGPSPEAVLREKPRKSVRLTLEDGTTLVMTTPTVQGDSLVGRVARSSSGPAKATSSSAPQSGAFSHSTGIPDSVTVEATGVPTTRVKRIEVRRLQPVQTMLALVGGTLLIAAVACSASDCMDFGWSGQGGFGD
jgi:hypothetical protein